MGLVCQWRQVQQMVKQIVIKLGRQLILSRREKNSLGSDGLFWRNQFVLDPYSLRQVVD